MQAKFESFWKRPASEAVRHFEKFSFEPSFDQILLKEEPIKEFPEVVAVEEVVEERIYEASEPPAPPSPLFTEEEKQQAYDEGFSKGRLEGYQEGSVEVSTSVEAEMTMHIKQIEKLLEHATANLDVQRREITYQVLLMSQRIWQKLFPVVEKAWSAVQIEKIVDDVLQDEKPEILRVQVHPKTKEVLQSRLSTWTNLAAVSLEPADNLKLSDCKLAWGASGLERNCEKISQEIEGVFKGFETILKESGQAPPEA